MKIATKLKTAVLVPVFMAAVAGVAITFQEQALETTLDNSDKVREIILNINYLKTLTYNYLLFQEERSKQQFLAEHGITDQMLSQITSEDAEQQRALDTLKTDIGNLKKLFVRIVLSYELQKANGENLAAVEAGERLSGRVLAVSNQTIRDGLILVKAVNERTAASQEKLNIFVFSLIICITVLLIIILAGTMATISASLMKLKRGVEIIGAGDLDHRVGMVETDEIGDLARAFDRMTVQLASSIAELRDSEERLRQSQAIEATNLGTLTKLHFGLSPEAHVDYHVFLAGLHPDDRERIHEGVQALLQPDSGGLYRTEYRTIGRRQGTLDCRLGTSLFQRAERAGPLHRRDTRHHRAQTNRKPAAGNEG